MAGFHRLTGEPSREASPVRTSVCLSGAIAFSWPSSELRWRRSDLDFEAHFHDLSGRDTKIGGRQICVEVHRREETLPPYRHPGHLAARNHHDPTGVEGDPLGVDAAQAGVAASEFQPLHHVGMFHKSEMQGNPGNASADRDELHALLWIDAGRIAADRRNQHYPLV